MDDSFINSFKEHLSERGIPFRNGVDRACIDEAQRKCGAPFPPDLQFLLLNVVVNDEKFIDWKRINDATLEGILDWPRHGLCFDIRHSNLWLDMWGDKPAALEGRIEKFNEYYFAHVPKLIPIFGHRYISSAPPESGNPVYSVYQSDIIIYGVNLESYLRNEYNMSPAGGLELHTPSGEVDFWRYMVERNNRQVGQLH